MVWMMCVECWVFFVRRAPYLTRIDVDAGVGSQLRVNFNVSFPDLHCDFASIDLWDKIGRNQVNVTRNVEKWQLDRDGERRAYQGRNRREIDLAHDAHLHPPLETLHADGVHVDAVTAADWDHFAEEHEFSFVNFYAPWCSFCQTLSPTWEVLAETVERRELPVAVAAVDCVAEATLCHDEDVQAFPTLRFYRHAERVAQGDYKFDRTLDALLEFVHRKLESENIYKHYPEARDAHKVHWNTDHPGCLVSGFLLVNRVPGNFHVSAHSRHHSLNTYRTNLSHQVHHLSFGLPLAEVQRHRLDRLDVKYHRTAPLDGATFAHADVHHAWHHYLHVVPTRYNLGRSYRDKFFTYQLVHADYLQPYEEWEPPEARFAFDVAPMAEVVARGDGKSWYDFLTGLLALLGGTFAVARFGNDLISRLTSKT